MVFALGACGGGGSAGETPGSVDKTTGTVQTTSGGLTTDKVEIAEFNFKPGNISVKAGTTVTWTNLDSFAHTVKPESGKFAESPQINKSGTFTHRFESAGSFPYFCGIHNSMTGTVTVT